MNSLLKSAPGILYPTIIQFNYLSGILDSYIPNIRSAAKLALVLIISILVHAFQQPLVQRPFWGLGEAIKQLEKGADLRNKALQLSMPCEGRPVSKPNFEVRARSWQVDD